MNVNVIVGDVLETPADVLVCPANPWLNMSGGGNGAILIRCPTLQAELHGILAKAETSALAAGSTVQTSAGSLPFGRVVHAIAIDPFYETSPEIVALALEGAFDLSVQLGACSVSLPTLGTGYGPMSIQSFGEVFAKSKFRETSLLKTHLVVRTAENADTLKSILE